MPAEERCGILGAWTWVWLGQALLTLGGKLGIVLHGHRLDCFLARIIITNQIKLGGFASVKDWPSLTTKTLPIKLNY